MDVKIGLVGQKADYSVSCLVERMVATKVGSRAGSLAVKKAG